MKLEYSFEKQKYLLSLQQMNREQLLETASLLLDSLYAHKDYLDTAMRQSLGIESKR